MQDEFRLYSNFPFLQCDPLVHRKHGFTLLDHCFKRSLILVNGGQGYGKSTMILSYLQVKKIPTVLVNLNSGQKHLPVFLETVSIGLSDFSKDTINSEEIHLLGTISKWNEDLAIVVDCDKNTELDLSCLDYILQLVQHSAPPVTFVLISRVRPKLPFIKLKAQGIIEEFKQDELRFQTDEIIEFFLKSGLHLDEIDAREILDFTGGWALSLPYMVEAWSDRPKQNQIDLHPFLIELLDEVLADESDSLNNDLLQLSLLHELKFETLPFLPVQLTAEKWKKLINDSFFLQKNEDESFRIIPLVRKYFYQHLLQLHGIESVRIQHSQIAANYENKYQYFYSFAHHVAGGHYEEAARLMQVMMNFYTPERFMLLIDGTLEKICPSISFSTFSMFLFRCVPIPVLQSYVPGLEKALQKLKEEGVSKTLLYLQHRLGIIQFYSGEVQRSKSLFLDSLKSSEQLKSKEFTIINLSLVAQCCRFEGDMEEGIHYARRALSEIEKIGRYDAHMHTVWILTELLLEQGQIDLAEPIFSELLRLSDQYHDAAARIYPLLAKAKFCRLKGDLNEALKLAELSLSHAEKFRFDPDLGWIHLEVGLIYKGLKDSENANRFFKQSAEYFKHHRYFYELANSFIEDKWALSVIQPENKEINPKTLRAEPQGTLSIQLLGRLGIWKDEQELKLQRKSSLMLLIYLAVHYHKRIPKDLLLEELFPEAHFQSQNNRFYVSLSTLRKSLEAGLKSGRNSSYIHQSGELYGLNLDRCSIDLFTFEKLVEEKEQSSEQRLSRLLQAEKLYKGNLLEEYPYEPFLEPIRERVKQTYLQVIREIGMIYWSKSDFHQGIHYFDRLLEYGRFSEPLYWDYIRMLLEQGFLQNAKQIAKQLIKNMEQEMGVPVTDRLQRQFPQLKM